jgi:hypothetical protein
MHYDGFAIVSLDEVETPPGSPEGIDFAQTAWSRLFERIFAEVLVHRVCARSQAPSVGGCPKRVAVDGVAEARP